MQVQIYDAAPLPQDLLAWLTDQMRAHGASGPDIASCRPNRRRGTEVSCVTKSGGADQYWYAFRTIDDQARFAHVVMGPSTLATFRYIGPMGRLLKSAQANVGHAGGDASAIGELLPSVEPSPNVANPIPTPVSDGASYAVPIEGLYLHLEFIAGVGGGFYPSYEPYILLSDGTITDDLGYYPSSNAGIADWRRRKPCDWGHYTRSGGTLSIQWDDSRRKPQTSDKWFVAKPGRKI